MPRSIRTRRLLAAVTTAVSLTLTGALAAPPATASASGSVPPARSSGESTHAYVVRVAPDTTRINGASATASVAKALAAVGVRPERTFTEAVDGIVVDLTGAQATWLATVPGVVAVTSDKPVELEDTEDSRSWGLDRIDQASLPRDGRYTYPSSAGQGVRAYIVDTGVMTTGPEFEGRVAPGFTAYPADPADQDCSGHGTHVAGTVGSLTYGVAKKATIVPVRVFSCSGYGTTSDIIAGLDWIARTHPDGVPGVVNMSVSSVKDPGVNYAVDSLVSQGLFIAVAAANDNTDACTRSPASATNAFTTGATTTSDARAYYSNWGTCLDGFAPGDSITSLSTVTGSAAIKSGTSMASPHVAGIAALYLGQNAAMTPAQVTAALKSSATASVTGAGTGSPNLLVNTLGIPSLSQPTSVSVTDITTTSAQVSWSAVTGPVTSYRVEYRNVDAGTASSLNVPAATTSVSLTGLVSGANYSVQVTALGTSLTGPASAAVTFRVALPVPEAPTGLKVTGTTDTTVTLSWTAPATGVAPDDYVVLLRKPGETLFATATEPVSTATTSTVASLTKGTTYEFAVRSSRAMQQSAPSASVLATPGGTAAVPGTPSGLKVTGQSPTTLSLAWTAPTSGAPTTDYEVQYRTQGATAWSTAYDGVSTTTAATVSGLKAATTYQVQVRALAGTAPGPFTTALTAATPAYVIPAPTALAAPARTTTSLTLTWNPVTVSGGSVTDYDVQYRTPGAATWTTFADGVKASTGAVVTGLSVGTTYEVQVRAVVSSTPGAFTAPLTTSTAFMAPGAPAWLYSPSQTATSLTWSWGAPSQYADRATDYELQYRARGGSLWTSVRSGSASTRTLTVTGLSSATTYEAQVRALAGTDPGAFSAVQTAATASPPALPSAPTNVRSTGSTTTTIALTWGLPTTNPTTVTDYEVGYRVSGASAWTTAPDGVSAVPGATLTGLAAGTSYDIRVRALAGTDGGPYATMVAATQAGAPGAPTGLKAATTTTTVSLTWTAPTGATGITDYTVGYRRSGTTTWTTFTDAVSATPAATVTGLSAGTAYDFQVRAMAGQTAGAYAQVSATTQPATQVRQWSGYVPVNPSRALTKLRLDARGTTVVRVPNVPAGATAVTLNLSVTGVTGTSYLSACPAGTAVATCATTSVMNPRAATASSALATVALGGTGMDQILVYNNANTVYLTVDVQGFYTPDQAGSAFLAQAPARALDTYMSDKQAATVTLANVPAGATAVALNLTSAAASAPGAVSVCPAGQTLAACGAAFNMNPVPGRDLSNAAVVKLGGPAGNQITVYNQVGRARVIVDVAGFFAPLEVSADAGRFQAITATRVMPVRAFAPREAYTLTIPNVPAGAKSVAINLTATGAATSVSYVSACPGGTSVAACATTSVMNPAPGVDLSNVVLLKLGGPNRNQILLYNNAGVTPLIVDVQGFYLN